MTHKILAVLAVFIIAFILNVPGCSTTDKAVSDTETIQGIEQKSILETVDYHAPDSTTYKEQINPVSVTDSADIETLIDSLSLRQRIGQLFFVAANGTFKSDDDPVFRDLMTKVKEYQVGGVIFFSGNVYGQAVLTNKLQNASRIPLWITQDMEYGAAMRVRGTTRFVPAMGVAATGDPDYAFWIGKTTAREAKALGVNQIYAPVLDVNNNPANPVINVRSFSGDPNTVALFGEAFIKGAESEGVISTAKHFPGHGDTDTDSHISLPTIAYDYSRLDSLELVPFRAAINNGLRSIMSAHIAFPKIGESPSLPGTMDGAIINGILQDSLEFDGMVVTDGLEMSGIASNYSPGSAVVKALQAGADLMLLTPDLPTAINEVEEAVKQGIITEQRITKSVRKLLYWKMQHGLFKQKHVPIDELSSKIKTRKNELLAHEISRKSLTLVKNEDGLLPIRAAEYPKVMVLAVADDETGETGSGFASNIREYHPDVTFHVLDKRTGREEEQEILEDANKADLLIIGSFIYVRSGQEVQISDEQMELLNTLPEKPSVLVAFGNPYVVGDLPESEAQLMAWAANDEQVHSVVPALFGGSKINGKLPIEIPGMYSFGHGLDLPQTAVRFDEPETVCLDRDSLQKIDRVMNSAVFDSTFPGGVVSVVKDGVIAYRKAFGYHTYKKLEPVKETDIYDLASLTKVMATTTSVMKLVDEGTLKLNDPVAKYFREFEKGDKSKITLQNLLLHNSGLPPFRVYIDSLKSEKEIIEAVKKEPLIHKPGEQYIYSDLGFILLGEIVEQVTGTSLDKFVRRSFYYPLGMGSTHFNPKNVGNWVSDRIPPTEIDTLYRNKEIQGEAHDERAWFLNGVAGHAGLFSSAYDLSVYTQMLMNKGMYAGKRYLSQEVVNTFTARQSPDSDRGYGFDHKSDGFSSAGTLTSPSTYGHTGFTGTSLWIDPEKNLAIIVLTNRTYPYRSFGQNISKVRAAVADAVISSIIE